MTVERVYARASVCGATARRWADLDTDHPEVAACVAAGLLSRTGPVGEAPPAGELARGCCGGR